MQEQDKKLFAKISKAVQRISKTLIKHEVKNYSAFGIWALAAYTSLSLPEQDVPKDTQKFIGLSRDELTVALSRLDQALPQEVSFALASWLGKNNTYLNNLQEASNDFATNYAHAPKQSEADKWISEKSFNIFETFPANVEQDGVWSLLASLIAMDITWDKKFKVQKDQSMSNVWGVEDTLFEEKSDIRFFTLDHKSYLVVHSKTNENRDVTVRSYAYVSPNEHSTNELQKEVFKFEKNPEKYTHISAMQAYDINTKGFNHAPSNGVRLPAWDLKNVFDVDRIAPELGSIFERILAPEDFPQTKQAVNASYNAEGFKAAAVTFTMLRAVSVSPQKTFIFSFTDPYIVKAYATIADDYSHLNDIELCLFDFVITKDDTTEAVINSKE